MKELNVAPNIAVAAVTLLPTFLGALGVAAAVLALLTIPKFERPSDE